MNGLKGIPTHKELSHLYDHFLQDAVNLDQLLLASQWARFDPRLGEIAVGYLERHWEELSPLELNQRLRRQVWPAAFGVLIAHLTVSRQQRRLLKHWQLCVMTDIAPASNEQFFIGLHALGGATMLRQATQSLKPYKQWHYLASQPMRQEGQGKARTLMQKASRQALLQKWLKAHRQITIEQYRQLLDGQISTRQAQRDLLQHPTLRKVGVTRGVIYRQVR